MATKYKGCLIYRDAMAGGYVWDESLYGAESDTVFATEDEAKADVDRYFGNGPAPRIVNNEIEA